MRLITILCSIFFLCETTTGLFGTVLIKKGFEDCHHGIYGRAEKKIAPEQTEDISTGVVSLTGVGPFRGIQFDPNSSAFTIRHTGTYVIDYFLKAFTTPRVSTEIIAIAIKVNGKLRGTRDLNPVNIPITNKIDGSYFSANGIIYENLKKGDTVSLVVIKIEPPSVFFANYYKDDDLPPSTVAYLAIHKAERKKK